MTVKAYLLYIARTGLVLAEEYEFDDDGRNVGHWSYNKSGRHSTDTAAWDRVAMEKAYGTAKGQRIPGIRGKFGSLDKDSLWRRVTKCQFLRYLRSQGWKV